MVGTALLGAKTFFAADSDKRPSELKTDAANLRCTCLSHVLSAIWVLCGSSSSRSFRL